jgi:beta-hydroxylase
VHELQRRLPTIQEELFQVLPYLPDSAWQSLRTRRGKEWSDDTGWAHLALIDNFRRRDDAVAVFPETARILDDVVGTERRMGPRLVAIAKQKARTGIPEHYDYMNWMLTLHTALGGPREGCGIVVDRVRRDWTVGDPVVMDTTFAHETYNESDEDLYLLLVDFWHPDLGVDEIDALRAFFAANSGV